MAFAQRLLLLVVLVTVFVVPPSLVAGDSGDVARLMEEAVKLGRENKNEKAVETFGKVLDQDPRQEKAHYFLVILYWKMGKKSQAIQEYLIVKALNPGLARKLCEMNPAIDPDGARESTATGTAVSTSSPSEPAPVSSPPPAEPAPETEVSSQANPSPEPMVASGAGREKGGQDKDDPGTGDETGAKGKDDKELDEAAVSELEDTAQYAASDEDRETAARSLLDNDSSSEIALNSLKEVCAKKGTVSGLREARDCIRKMIKLGYVSESDGDAEINELSGPQPEN